MKPFLVADHKLGQLGGKRQARSVDAAQPHDLRIGAQPGRVIAARATRGLSDQISAKAHLDRHFLSGVDALAQVARPGLVPVHPTHNGIVIATDRRNLERTAPAIVDQRLHGSFSPLRRAFLAVEHHTRDDVVTINERVGLDDHGVAHHALDRVRPTIDLGLNPFDDNPRSAFTNLHHVPLR
jgi:hypothetical protein